MTKTTAVLVSLGVVAVMVAPLIYVGVREFYLCRRQRARNKKKLAEFNQLCEEIKSKRLEA